MINVDKRDCWNYLSCECSLFFELRDTKFWHTNKIKQGKFDVSDSVYRHVFHNKLNFFS